MNNENFFQKILKNKKSKIGIVLIAIMMLLSILAPLIAPYGALERVGNPHEAPSWDHLLGTTRLGYDVFSQLMYGGRVSLFVGLAAGSMVAFLAVMMGITAAYFGKWVDEFISVIINIVLVIPQLPLLIVLAALIGETGPLSIALIIGLTSWAWGGRVVRSQALAVRQRDFIHASELIGDPPFHIILKELLPNLISIIGSNFIGVVIYAIMTEATLSFIGLGNAEIVTWGTQLYHANNSAAVVVGAWWELLAPCIAIIIVGTGLALLNFGIDEVSNPKLQAQTWFARWKKEQQKAQAAEAKQ
ncbi:ABC transporter permease [Vibrio sp. DW001]|uniref:ABC transporter permease n=1 Tax=Vibrio sp. DW001 TaxID=2912315 RepID=UPI0023B06F02|nr:ABC transporter permease [Vibrio sp. DW001]WED27834.1 ABC transporter permease [Vibrio sp. DW001]